MDKILRICFLWQETWQYWDTHSYSYLEERISTCHHNATIQGGPHIHITHAHTGCHNVAYSKHGVAHKSTSHLNHTRIKECLGNTETLTAKVLHNVENNKHKYVNRESRMAEIQKILTMTNTNTHVTIMDE
jgi:hypothetical protein